MHIYISEDINLCDIDTELLSFQFGQPTTYEVSAPVPSNLAYSEHRLSLPSPNSIQYNATPVKQLKPNFEQPQVLIQPYEQSLAQQVTASPLNQYSQAPQQFYNQYQPNQQYVQQPNLQTITYHQQVNQARNQPQPEQRDLKHQPAPSQVLEKQVIQEVYLLLLLNSFLKPTTGYGFPGFGYSPPRSVRILPYYFRIFKNIVKISSRYLLYY